MTLVVPYKLLDEDAGLVQIWGQVSDKLEDQLFIRLQAQYPFSYMTN